MRLWIMLGVAGLLALGAAFVAVGLACNSLIGGATEGIERGIDFARDELEREQRQSSITQAQFRSVRLGTPRAAVERRLGQPRDVPGRTSIGGPVPAGSSCAFYDERGQPLLAGPTYRFCFVRGRLAAKSVL